MIFLKKHGFLLLAIILVGGLTVLIHKSPKSDSSAPETVEVSTLSAETSESENPDYLRYIPIWENGEESNLYDLLQPEEILYFRRYDCSDCERYESSILRLLESLNYPYQVIEVNKAPDSWEIGPAIASSVVKSIGIKEIPTVAFIKNGVFITKIENAFSENGDEIRVTTEKVFN